MSEKDCLEIRQKVLEGVKLAFIRLVKEKVKEDKELVFSRNGRLETIKASELF